MTGVTSSHRVMPDCASKKKPMEALITDKKKAEELNEKDLDEVQGAGAKGLLGDDLGILRGSIQKPGDKGGPDKFGDTTGESPNNF